MVKGISENIIMEVRKHNGISYDNVEVSVYRLEILLYSIIKLIL